MKTILGILLFFLGGPLIMLGWTMLCSLIPLPFPFGLIVWIGVPIIITWIGYKPRRGGMAEVYIPEEDAGGL